MDTRRLLRTETPVHILPGRSAQEAIAYAPLRRLAFGVNAAAGRVLGKLAEGLAPSELAPEEARFAQTLRELGLFEPADDRPAPPRAHAQASYKPTQVTLFMTGRCNLHCSYCYARGGDTDDVMEWDVAKAAIDFVVENALATQAGEIAVIFHGDGEPTLAWPLLERCIEYAEDRAAVEGLTCRFEAGMNGIIADKRVRWLAPKLSNLTISLDGPPDIHDAQRPLASVAREPSVSAALEGAAPATTSSKIVLRTLRILDELAVSYGIRCTVTTRSVLRLPEVVDYICGVSSASAIQLEPSFPVGRALETDEPVLDPGTFVRGFLAARLVARRHGRRLVFAGARPDQVTNRFCEALSGAFNVTHDGRVSSCYEVFSKDDERSPLFALGALDRTAGRFVVDLDRVTEKSRWSSIEKAPCQTCFAQVHCGGDCAAKLAVDGDPGSTVNPGRCYVIREITRAQIFSLYGFGDVSEPSAPWVAPPPTPGPLVQIRRRPAAPAARP
jgi:uncharacterized protein